MPLIDENHAAVTESSADFWTNELANAKIILTAVNAAIYAISTANHQSYELDTGQTKQRVTRVDLPALIAQREKLMEQIRQLEKFLGIDNGQPSVIQVVPAW